VKAEKALPHRIQGYVSLQARSSLKMGGSAPWIRGKLDGKSTLVKNLENERKPYAIRGKWSIASAVSEDRKSYRLSRDARLHLPEGDCDASLGAGRKLPLGEFVARFGIMVRGLTYEVYFEAALGYRRLLLSLLLKETAIDSNKNGREEMIDDHREGTRP